MVVESLLKDAGILEIVPVPGSGYDVRIDYPKPLRDAVFSLYETWMQPSLQIFTQSMSDSAATGERTEAELRERQVRMEKGIGQSLHAYMDDRRKAASEGIRTLPELMSAQVMALRAVVQRRPDWPERMDEVASGISRKRKVGTAWERVLDDEPNWLPSLNRALGFAGVPAEALSASASAERHLAHFDGALVPEPGIFDDHLGEANELARAQGETIRQAFTSHAETRVAAVRDLVELQSALRQYVDRLNTAPDSFDLPNVLEWKQAIMQVSKQIIHYETRKGSLKQMIDQWEPDEPVQALDTMQASHRALSEENGKLVAHLRNVREGYQRVGKRLEALAAIGITFDAGRPVGLAGLLTLVQSKLREIAIPHPQRPPATS